MGSMSSHVDVLYPDVTPKWKDPATFDPTLGFEHQRIERKSIATEEEMAAAHVEPQLRDYCAHNYIDFLKCRREHFPWVLGCKDELHTWEQCQFDDFVLRMKEYERERRLLERSQRKANKSSVEVEISN